MHEPSINRDERKALFIMPFCMVCASENIVCKDYRQIAAKKKGGPGKIIYKLLSKSDDN